MNSMSIGFVRLLIAALVSIPVLALLPDAIAQGKLVDCNANGIDDRLELANAVGTDCNRNDVLDACEIRVESTAPGGPYSCTSDCDRDCNDNGLPDACDVLQRARGLNIPSNLNLPAGFKATVFATGLERPGKIVLSEGGPFGEYLYVAVESGMVRVDVDGNVERFALAIPQRPDGLAFGPGAFGWSTDLYVSAAFFRRVTADGETTILAGEAGNGMAFGFEDLLYTSDWPDKIARADPTGNIENWPVQFSMGRIADLEFDPFSGGAGSLLATDDVGDNVFRIAPDGTISLLAVFDIHSPNTLAFGRGGPFGTNLYVSSLAPFAVLRIEDNGAQTIFASLPLRRPGGIAFGGGGVFGRDLYVTGLDTGDVIRISPNSLPDPDCNDNEVLDACEILDGASTDADGNGIPDECCSSAVQAQPVSIANDQGKLQALVANRYLMLSADEEAGRRALRVTFEDLPPPFDSWTGEQLWVGPTSSVGEIGSNIDPPTFPAPGSVFSAATLRCEPYFADWTTAGDLHIFHEGIIPEGAYSIEVIQEACNTAVEENYSAPLVIVNSQFGDVLADFTTAPPGSPNGDVEIIDTLGVIGRFVSAPGSIRKARADLDPNCVDLLINITDVLATIKGFQGVGYPFAPSADDPCDSTCLNPLP